MKAQSPAEEPDEGAIAFEITRAFHPFTTKPGDLNRLRDRLLDLMWDDVGVIRDADGLDRALGQLAEFEAELLRTGVPDTGSAFNLTWHDWLNLRSLCETSRVIALAAKRRENSRGAHFRSDFPEPGDLETSSYTVVRQDKDGRQSITDEPVHFTRVRPGESLLQPSIAAE